MVGAMIFAAFGEQTQGISFTPAEKTNVAKALLNKLRVDRIEIASARVSEGEMDGVMRTTSWAEDKGFLEQIEVCLLYTSPSPRDRQKSRMPSSA